MDRHICIRSIVVNDTTMPKAKNSSWKVASQTSRCPNAVYPRGRQIVRVVSRGQGGDKYYSKTLEARFQCLISHSRADKVW